MAFSALKAKRGAYLVIARAGAPAAWSVFIGKRPVRIVT